MKESISTDTIPTCRRCERTLSGEKPVRLPDGMEYCAACCDKMATEAFEMETGVPFVEWIEKHPVLVMQHQPMEMYIRRMSFVIPAVFTLLGVLLTGMGGLKAGGLLEGAAQEGVPAPDAGEVLRAGLGYLAIGLGMVAFFGWLAFRQGKQFLRARDFRLTLKDGVFNLRFGRHEEVFKAGDVERACVVRPGTVGATEGALGLKDGRMLTLDSCLSDLHALGVVMDLRFREDFPPTPEDLARERRVKLRKIRGLSD